MTTSSRPPAPVAAPLPVPQDLHIHTTFSRGDGAVVPEQTVSLVASVGHARIVGISDHIEHITGERFQQYEQQVRAHGLVVGVEVNGHRWVEAAQALAVEYFIYHCYDNEADYRGAEQLLRTDKPVIIAHPHALGTDLNKVPLGCLVEINNRYVWRSDWRRDFTDDIVRRFRFVISSDAHQPHWLNQNVARMVAAELGIEEALLFAASR